MNDLRARSQSASPLPSQRELLARLAGRSDGVSALDALTNVTTPPTEVEDFRPLGESLEWRLADAYWEQAGVIPFVRNDVPYLVNNTGRLSENAAALVFAACEEMGKSLPQRIVLLELGAGTGLHARYFLDAFLAECRNAARDYYVRLIYVVSDRFEGTVRGWQRDQLFTEHEGHVALRVCDASAPGEMSLPDGGPAPPLGPPLAVFCNYVLDVLPSAIARRSTVGLEQLCVRTHLAGGVPALNAAGFSSLDEVRALAASHEFADVRRLLPLLPQLELETAFRPWKPSGPTEEALAAAISGDERVIINAAALTCLEQLLSLVQPSGWILVNDYGPVRAQDVAAHLGVQRFGGSVASGLNFPLLEQVLRARGVSVVAAEGDEQRRVHTRLIGRNLGDQTQAVLGRRFRLEADQYLDAPLAEARRYVAAGRTNEALAAYRQLVERNPNDWQMLGEAAEYVGLQLRDHQAGLQLARSALERNPWCSAWLWNILGDCLFYGGRLDEAHDAFVQAQRIDPDDPRTNLNLAYTLSVRGTNAEALAAIARGLAQDSRVRGAYRQRLLEKQAQVLGAISERASAEQERASRRAERFR